MSQGKIPIKPTCWMYVLYILHRQASSFFIHFLKFVYFCECLYGIRFHIWGFLLKIISVPDVTVCLYEDLNVWKFLRLYLFFLVTNRSVTQYFFRYVCFFTCWPLIFYQKGARNHCKSNARPVRECSFYALFRYQEVNIQISGQ